MTAPAPTPPTFTQRPWVTAGVALTAAGIVAAAPVAVPDVPQFNFPEIELTAGLDDLNPLPALEYAFNSTLGNVNGLFTQIGDAPLFPVIGQVLANQAGYISGLINGTTDIGTVFGQIGDNIGNVFAAPFAANLGLLTAGDASLDLYALETLVASIPFGHQEIFELMQAAASLDPTATIKPILDFMASPASGILLGTAGPIIAPGIALGAGLGHAFDDLGSQNFAHAFGDLINLPANLTNAFLNGSYLDAVNGPTNASLNAIWLLDALGIPTSFNFGFGDISLVEAGIDNAGLSMGGLLSGPGSLFNAFDFLASGSAVSVGDWSLIEGIAQLPGHGPGALATMLTLPETIAAAINNSDSIALDSWNLLGDLPFAGEIGGAMTAGLDQIGDLFTGFGDMVNQLGGMLDVTDLAGLLGIDTFGNLMLSIPQLLLSMLF